MEPLKNQFFRKSVEKAGEYLKNRRRLAGLFTSASLKLRHVKFKSLNTGKFIEKIKVFMRMVKAYSNGSYKDLPWRSLLLIVGSIIYFVMPIDVIPDFIPVSGLLDDFTVVLWVYKTLKEEVDLFMEWELMRMEKIKD